MGKLLDYTQKTETWPFSLIIYFYICSVVFFAGFTQGLSGFGALLLTLPLLAIFLDIKIVIPLVALFGLTISIILMVQLRKHLNWKKVFPLFIGAMPGIPVGVFFLKRLDKGYIQWILGLVLICYSIYSLFFRSPNKGISRGWAYAFGFLAGCSGGAISSAGPPVIVYSSLQNWSKDEIKATLQGFFFASATIIVFFQAINGITTLTVLRYFLISLPFLVVGTYVGSFFYGKISREDYKRVMCMLLFFLGALMIYRA
jgi:uncharacterized membrane protein YfcA